MVHKCVDLCEWAYSMHVFGLYGCFRDKCEAYLFNLSRLWDVIAFLYCWLCWVRFQWSHCVNSAHVNPWLLGLSDACGSASQRRGQWGHFDLCKDNFNFKHVPLFAAAIIGVTAAALCSVPSSHGNPGVCINFRPYCSLWQHLTKSYIPCWENTISH